MKVRMLSDAKYDAERAGDRLEREERGFGLRFAKEMQKAKSRIRTDTYICPKTEDGPENPETREYFMHLFNYRVIFAIWSGEAVIVAVIHAARPPSKWLPRLDQLED